MDVLPMPSGLFALLWGGYQLAKARYGAAFDFAVAPVAAIHMSFVIEAYCFAAHAPVGGAHFLE